MIREVLSITWKEIWNKAGGVEMINSGWILDMS